MITSARSTYTHRPTGYKVAPLSYVKIEAIANKLRPLLPSEPKREGGLGLDAWRILEQTLPLNGYAYQVREVQDLKDCAAYTAPEQHLVVMREDVYEGLFTGNLFSSSTVVHELSHIALGHAVTLHRGAPAGEHAFFEDSEWQAHALTAALMMPIPTCKRAQSPAKLAAMCGTSVQAASYRLARLRKGRLI